MLNRAFAHDEIGSGAPHPGGRTVTNNYHISGFIDANFHDIQIDDLWLGWTEDPADTNT